MKSVAAVLTLFSPSIRSFGWHLAWRTFAAIVLMVCQSGIPIALADTTRLSVSSSGEEGNGAGSIGTIPSFAISRTAEHVAFLSKSSNLFYTDDTDTTDLFFVNRTTQVISSPSVELGGAGRQVSNYAISDNGMYVVYDFFGPSSHFPSPQPLVEFAQGLMLRRILSEFSLSVLRNPAGEALTTSSGVAFPAVVNSGNRVYFTYQTMDSSQRVLTSVSPDTRHLYSLVIDALGNAESREIIDVNEAGVPGNAGIRGCFKISPDGDYVVFSSAASNLVAGDTNGKIDTFIYVTATRSVERVSVNTAGSEADGDSVSDGRGCGVDVSDDGRYVVFSSNATNLDSNYGNPGTQVYLRDRVEKLTVLSSRSTSARASTTAATGASISADGRYVSFFGAVHKENDVDTVMAGPWLMHDRNSGRTVAVPVIGIDAADKAGLIPQMLFNKTSDAVTFYSASDALVLNDKNGANDTFFSSFIYPTPGPTATPTPTPTSTPTATATPTATSTPTPTPTSTPTATNTPTAINTPRVTPTPEPTQTPTPDASGQGVSEVLLPDTVLDSPPIVTVRRRNVILKLRRFSFALNRVRREVQRQQPMDARAATNARLKVTYEVRLNSGTGALRADQRRKFSNRATVTYNNLPPGNYSAAYRAIAVNSKNKRVFSTKFSPKQNFTIR